MKGPPQRNALRRALDCIEASLISDRERYLHPQLIHHLLLLHFRWTLHL